MFNASEFCLDASLEAVQPHLASLQDTLNSAVSLLLQMNSGLNSPEPLIVFLKEFSTKIISELVNLNTELSSTAPSFVGLNYQQSSSESASTDSDGSLVAQEFKNLINKCMGDIELAERLIKYERQRHSELDREGAIQSAIVRWESDNC